MDDNKLLLDFIERNLPNVPDNFDEGLGIASERFFYNKVITRYFKDNWPKTVLEAPSDGLMGAVGMNSAIFARNGAKVVLGSPSEKLLKSSEKFWKMLKLDGMVEFKSGIYDKLPFPDNDFDVVTNYCMFEHFHDG